MSDISAMTVKYWTDTLLGWAEDRLMPPQFDECKAAIGQLMASAERAEQAEKSRDKMTEAYYKRKERSAEVEQERGAVIDFLIPFLPTDALPYQESALQIVKTAIGAIELKKDRELAAARSQVKALREALAPFAACGAIWKKDSTPDTHYVHWSQRGWNIPELPDAGISVGDLRKAYDALRDTEPHGGQ